MHTKNYADPAGLPAACLNDDASCDEIECWAGAHPSYFWKIDFGTSAWIPLTPSTAWVTTRSIVALSNM